MWDWTDFENLKEPDHVEPAHAFLRQFDDHGDGYPAA